MKLWGSLKDKYQESILFIRFVYDHFFEDDCTYRASALAFTSLLAVVPLMSVGLSILSSFPVFKSFSGPLQDFIFENFVPATGKIIQGYLQQFASQVSQLSLFGILFLFITAILLLVTIERAMNKIWRVNNARNGVAAFLLYWAILSLAPLLLGLSLAATSYVFSLPMIKEQYTPSYVISYSPFILSLIAFNFLYVVVPNCRVKVRHGFIGALIAALMFETAKIGFAYYLSNYNSYQLLYGAFATIPIFFVWVYWVWVITLLGAEISYALSVHYQRRTGHQIDGFTHALLWLSLLWKAQQKGEGLSFIQLVNSSRQPFAIGAAAMTKILESKKLIHQADNQEYMLSQDMSEMSLYKLSKLLDYRLPNTAELESLKALYPKTCQELLVKTDKELNNLLNAKLSLLFQ